MHYYIRSVLLATCLLTCTISASHATLVVEEDQQIVAPGAYIDTRVINHGLIAGSQTDRLIFSPNALVSGNSQFEYTINLGTFAPGNSPAIISGTNQAFGGTVQIELGGPSPGFGSDNHDQINDTATLTLGSSTVLNILSFNNFVPTPGDTFEILTRHEGLAGNFGSVVIDTHFTLNGITFEQIISNPTGMGSLTLVAVAVPEPGAFWFLSAVGGLVLTVTKKR